MPSIYCVTVNLDRKDPDEPPLIGEHLVIADSLEQLLTRYPEDQERKRWVHERITEIRLLASTTSTAAPMAYLDIRDTPDKKATDQGKTTPVVH
ncbi:hypothetical protein [Pseudodesulfovibrio portus]|uniref:Uncharacterized protein n=1 Tax=Pseudodesulfovibrio portus TaxID=231439 RepID=A0ABM8AQB9_9BACT|nr:hypothetical protein [Pseudodesulfovibrio portus]BDQ33586.1 hypothetical protein JCM14722_11280 [Pseudodesulfovibrio portus]